MKSKNLKAIPIPKGKRVVDVVVGTQKVFIKLADETNDKTDKNKTH
jgi:ubiquinone/menaquinone biosynthesis C-methylase UbiE